jgi:eukaryotic-like serine/threonine-protein kinase
LPIENGFRLGPYEIEAPLGAGGMGEVYRARDTRLEREVALKLLPAAFAADPDRLARFEREAKLLASLNHPGIAHLYGFEPVTLADGSRAHLLVMELAAGEDLAERLKRGPLPLDDAIDVARQVAEALEEAHERGIVHRDLKPANVKLTPDGKVKVLDFGLAKAWAGEAAPGVSSPELSQSPTLAHTGTAAGLILGTAAYMSPEQARGRSVDKRADVWAFGALLFELLTGRQLFQGETVSDVLAAVLTKEPDWSRLRAAEAPPRVERLLRRCLERDPRQRLRDIGEARIALAASDAPDDAAATAVPGGARRRLLQALPWLLAVAALAAWLAQRSSPAHEAPLERVAFSFEAEDSLYPMVQVSPDGRTLAFNQGPLATTNQLFLRALGSSDVQPVPLPQDRAVSSYFWSPDAQQLAIVSRGALLALDATSGAQRTIADLGQDALARGGAWGPDGTILVSMRGTIYRVPAAGGALSPLVEPQADRYSWNTFPRLLPDGRRFVFMSEVREAGANVPVIRVAELAEPSAARVILQRGLLAGVTRDHLLYCDMNGTLMSTAVDPNSFEPRGMATAVAQRVSLDARNGFVAASNAGGILAYRTAVDPQTEFVWLDRSGRRLGRLGEPGPWHNFDLSPDGTRVIASTRQRGVPGTLFLIDAARGVTTQVLESSDSASDPTWSPDATRIAYRIRATLVTRPVQGGDESVVLKETGYPDSWSRDGRFIAYGAPRVGHYDLFAIDLTARDKPPVLLVQGAPQADEPRFSPNGRWIAFHSAVREGAEQVSVIPFPPTGERWQISGDGGVQPRWSPTGDELFYLDLAGRLISVAMPGSDPRRAGVPQPLFETHLTPSNAFDQLAVAARDRFLLRLPFGENPGVPVHVIVGWDR